MATKKKHPGRTGRPKLANPEGRGPLTLDDVRAVLGGEPVRDVAERLHVSTNAVRAYVKRWRATVEAETPAKPE